MITSYLSPQKHISKEALYRASENPPRSLLPAPRPVEILLSLFPAGRDLFSDPCDPDSSGLLATKRENPRIILSTFRSEHRKILEESAPHLNQTGKYLPADFLTQVEHAEPRPTHPRRNAPTLIFHSREPRTTSSNHLNLTPHEFRVRPNTEKRNPYRCNTQTSLRGSQSGQLHMSNSREHTLLTCPNSTRAVQF